MRSAALDCGGAAAALSHEERQLCCRSPELRYTGVDETRYGLGFNGFVAEPLDPLLLADEIVRR